MKTWISANLIFRKLNKYRDLCTCDLALRNCYTCDNRSPKNPVIENKACDNRITLMDCAVNIYLGSSFYLPFPDGNLLFSCRRCGRIVLK